MALALGFYFLHLLRARLCPLILGDNDISNGTSSWPQLEYTTHFLGDLNHFNPKSLPELNLRRILCCFCRVQEDKRQAKTA